jgi:hypothetical protein
VLVYYKFFSFKKYFDLVENLTYCIDELDKSNMDLCQDLINDYCNKQELLDNLE